MARRGPGTIRAAHRLRRPVCPLHIGRDASLFVQAVFSVDDPHRLSSMLNTGPSTTSRSRPVGAAAAAGRLLLAVGAQQATGPHRIDEHIRTTRMMMWSSAVNRSSTARTSSWISVSLWAPPVGGAPPTLGLRVRSPARRRTWGARSRVMDARQSGGNRLATTPTRSAAEASGRLRPAVGATPRGAALDSRDCG